MEYFLRDFIVIFKLVHSYDFWIYIPIHKCVIVTYNYENLIRVLALWAWHHVMNVGRYLRQKHVTYASSNTIHACFQKKTTNKAQSCHKQYRVVHTSFTHKI